MCHREETVARTRHREKTAGVRDEESGRWRLKSAKERKQLASRAARKPPPSSGGVKKPRRWRWITCLASSERLPALPASVEKLPSTLRTFLFFPVFLGLGFYYFFARRRKFARVCAEMRGPGGAPPAPGAMRPGEEDKYKYNSRHATIQEEHQIKKLLHATCVRLRAVPTQRRRL